MTYWCLWVIMQVPSCIHVAVLDFSALGVLLSGPLGCLAAGSDQDKIELRTFLFRNDILTLLKCKSLEEMDISVSILYLVD